MTSRLVAPLVAAALVATPAAGQPGPCLNTAEAEAVALVALPDIIRETGRVCAARLPADSLVRRTTGPFIDKYQVAADRAWPAARVAIGKLSDPAVTLLLQSDYARPLLTTLVAPLVVGRIAISDCATIDRLAADLAPLPARNTAGLIVTTLRFLKAEKARNPRGVAIPDLPVCPL